MEIVASHLTAKTLELLGKPGADLFGRSSFNRFYYSAYLDVRRELVAMFPDAPTMHAVMPDYLSGEIVRKLKRIREGAKRVGDHELMQLCSRAIHAAQGLSEMLKAAYKTRVVADYMPNVSVDFTDLDGDFSLDDIRISVAKSWPNRARGFIASIRWAMRSGNA